MRRTTVLGGTVLAGAVVLASCGTGTGAVDAEDASAGMGVPRQAVEEFSAVPRTVRARVHVAGNGCFLGSLPGADDRYLVVWPPDTEIGSSGDELALADGTTVRDGDVLAGAGMLAPTRELEGFGDDGYWDHAVGYCTPRASEVLVLDPGATAQSQAFDAEERALVRRAVRRLEELDASGRGRRLPVVLSTEAVSVQVFQDLAADVVLRRCVDLTDRGTRPDGPVVQEVLVRRYENRTWRVVSTETTEEHCAG